MSAQRLARNCWRLWLVATVTLLALATIGPFALGQDATGKLVEDVPTAVKLTGQGLLAGDANWKIKDFTQYGNWYGPGWSGGIETEGEDQPGNKQPMDSLDAIAMEHDFAYQIAEEQGKLHGSEWENGLKAIADQIAVRKTKLLPEDPRQWDIPPGDPDTAGRYRDRLKFGFVYWGGYNQAKSDFKTAFSGIKYLFNPGDFPKFDAAQLEAEAKQRAQDWYKRPDVRPMYRLDLTASRNYLVMGEAIWIQARLVMVGYTAAMGAPGATDVHADLAVSGPAQLSAATISSPLPVYIFPTRKLLGLFSSNGEVVTVTASHEGGSYDLISSSIRFIVAETTNMTLSPKPAAVYWPFNQFVQLGGGPPCVDVVLQARLTDSQGNGVVNMPLELQAPGPTFPATTDSEGVATWSVPVCPSDLGDSTTKMLPFSARMTKTTALDGTVYVPSTAATTVAATKEDAVLVSGNVSDSRSGYRISGATVMITGGPGVIRFETTDVLGYFSAVVPKPSDLTSAIAGTVTASGYEAGAFTVGADGQSHDVKLMPLAATLAGLVVDQKTGDPLDGASVRVTQPFEKVIFTRGGEFVLTGLFVGDTVTMTAGAINHLSYTKSGKVTLESASVTFRIPQGKGEMSDALDATGTQFEDLPVLHSLMVWASPADPGVMQDVTVTAQIFPPEPGVLVEISMHGTDGYAKSTTAMTNAMGKVFLYIPGAAEGVVDDVVARIVGERVRVTRQLKYSF